MKKAYFLILLIILAFPFACKYEDGPLISFCSPEKRLYGNYTLVKYDVNGEDSLSIFYDSLGLNCRFFYDDVDYLNLYSNYGPRKDGKGCLLFWEWSLINDDKTLKIDKANGTSQGTGPFGVNKTPEWEILKLKNSKIKMKTNYNGKEYLIELETL